MSFTVVLLLSFIEGLTEFLPISSTGHLILASFLLGINEEGFVKSFNIIIQFGAIMSVLVLYWRRFIKKDFDFYFKLGLAFLPAAVIGLLIKSKIDELLGSVKVVSWALIIGGLVLIISDYFFSDESLSKKKSFLTSQKSLTFQKLETMSYGHVLLIGLVQCLAFIPGVSRAAATILGGLFVGLSKKDATEFSFFLAVPTLAGASFVKGISLFRSIESSQILPLSLGVLFSFFFALIAIRFFIYFVSHHGFKYFGIYRILLGVGILILLAFQS